MCRSKMFLNTNSVSDYSFEIECANQVGVYMEGNHHDMTRNTCFHCPEDFYESVYRCIGELDMV
jgi:hypothetical protein